MADLELQRRMQIPEGQPGALHMGQQFSPDAEYNRRIQIPEGQAGWLKGTEESSNSLRDLLNSGSVSESELQKIMGMLDSGRGSNADQVRLRNGLQQSSAYERLLEEENNTLEPGWTKDPDGTMRFQNESDEERRNREEAIQNESAYQRERRIEEFRRNRGSE